MNLFAKIAIGAIAPLMLGACASAMYPSATIADMSSPDQITIRHHVVDSGGAQSMAQKHCGYRMAKLTSRALETSFPDTNLSQYACVAKSA